MTTNPRVIVRSRWYAAYTAGFFLLAAFLMSTFLFQKGGHDRLGVDIFSAIIVALCLVAVVRWWQGSTVIAEPPGVTARHAIRTRHWLWDQVDRFVADTRPNGVVGYRRRMLGIRLATGETHWCTDINCRPGKEGQSTWIDVSVANLNAARPHPA